MTAAEFTAWVAHMKAAQNVSEQDIRKALGCGQNQITRWKLSGAPAYIGLACAALSTGVPAWVRGTVKAKKKA